MVLFFFLHFNFANHTHKAPYNKIFVLIRMIIRLRNSMRLHILERINKAALVNLCVKILELCEALQSGYTVFSGFLFLSFKDTIYW